MAPYFVAVIPDKRVIDARDPESSFCEIGIACGDSVEPPPAAWC